VLLAGYLSLVVAAGLGLAAPVTETGTRPVQVEFDAPEGCSGADAFFGSLRSRSDRVRQAEGNEPRTTLQVRLTRVRGQVVGELRMLDDRGGTDTRKVQGASCDDVVQALSLTAALAVDPSALLSAPTTTSAPVPAAPAAPLVPPAVAPPAKEASTAAGPEAADSLASRPMRPVPGVEFGVGPVGAALLSGSFSPGAALAVRKNLTGDGAFDGWFRPALGLAVVYVRNDLLQSPQAAQVSLAGLAGTVCPLRWTASILTFQPCALALAGWLSASGRQVTHPSSVDRLWLSAGGVLRTAAYLGQGVSLELEGGITAPLVKRRFYATTPSNLVAETPGISPIVGLGLTFGL
jgi:hypothetical protein